MTDTHSKEVRSRNMSHIRSKDTKPEVTVRKYLFSKGFRYRKNVKTLPGCPDIVLPKYKTVILLMAASGINMTALGSFGRRQMKIIGERKSYETLRETVITMNNWKPLDGMSMWFGNVN